MIIWLHVFFMTYLYLVPQEEQCRVFDLLQCRSSVFNSLLDIVQCPSIVSSVCLWVGWYLVSTPSIFVQSDWLTFFWRARAISTVSPLRTVGYSTPGVLLWYPRFAVCLFTWRLWWVWALSFLLPGLCFLLPLPTSTSHICRLELASIQITDVYMTYYDILLIVHVICWCTCVWDWSRAARY